MSTESDQHVRFYFCVSISCLIPPDSDKKRRGVPGSRKKQNLLERIQDDLEAKLSKDGFQVSYRKHAPIDGAPRLYAADFIVSALYSFPAAQVLTRREGYSGFSIEKKAFSKARTILQRKIKESLKWDYVVNAIAYEYAASRFFCFEVYLGGILRLEHVISSQEIADWDGSVEDAIEHFNTRVVDHLKENNCDGEPKTTERRPEANVYEFELSATKYFAFGENDVVGGLVSMEKDMPYEEAVMLGIDCDDEALTAAISSERDAVEICLELLPSDTAVIGFTLDFVDCKEGFYEYSDELL